MSITIKDIARMVNVSHTTVSRALNDSPLIKKETRDRIKEIAKAHNYVPNFNAKSLVLAKSYNIGLFFSTLKKGTTAHFFQEVIVGVNNAVEDQYTLSVKGIDDYKNFFAIQKRYFDGIILMSQSLQDDEFINHVINEDIPLAVLNRELGEENVINIISDDIEGAFNITEHIIKQGHTRIGIIEGKQDFKASIHRRRGFMNALEKYKIPFNPLFSVAGNYDLESEYQAMKKMLKKAEMPTALFCFNDEMAVGAMKAINESNLRIPEDISIAGFDDSVFSAYLHPALTTVRRSIEKISNTGARLLLEMINKPGNVKHEKLFVHTELVVRESVKKLKS
jgi:DNA-binding LacI/PurR family transcriptional regulator